jgi:hypothetical protein
MKKAIRNAMIGLAASSSMLVAAAQQPTSQQPTAQQPTAQQPTAQQPAAPQAQPSLIPPSKAASPAAPANAQGKAKKNSVGKGTLIVTVQQPVDFWQEQVSTAGGPVTTDFLYDPNVGVLYGYREDSFACSNGQTATGGILEALYTSTNKSGRPAGSGWYAVGLDTGKCGATNSGIYGCRFDVNGNPTECGVATINNQTGDITVVPAQ